MGRFLQINCFRIRPQKILSFELYIHFALKLLWATQLQPTKQKFNNTFKKKQHSKTSKKTPWTSQNVRSAITSTPTQWAAKTPHPKTTPRPSCVVPARSAWPSPPAPRGSRHPPGPAGRPPGRWTRKKMNHLYGVLYFLGRAMVIPIFSLLLNYITVLKLDLPFFWKGSMLFLFCVLGGYLHLKQTLLY